MTIGKIGKVIKMKLGDRTYSTVFQNFRYDFYVLNDVVSGVDKETCHNRIPNTCKEQ